MLRGESNPFCIVYRKEARGTLIQRVVQNWSPVRPNHNGCKIGRTNRTSFLNIEFRAPPVVERMMAGREILKA